MSYFGIALKRGVSLRERKLTEAVLRALFFKIISANAVRRGK
jgi:hypothetical protein